MSQSTHGPITASTQFPLERLRERDSVKNTRIVFREEFTFMQKIKINLIADIVLKDGQKRLAFKNPNYYHDQVNRLNDQKKVMVTIENVSSTRSHRQNAYWHGACFPIIAELTGYTMLEAKELCKKQFIKPKIVSIKEKEYEIPRGTADLTKWEGVDFTDAVRGLAVELGGYIPTPLEAGYQTEDSAPERKELPEYDENCPTPLI